MPYVNCPECGIRSFALAPWSTVDRCPTCEAPLTVPRQSVAKDLPERPFWQHGDGVSLDSRRTLSDEAQGTR